MQDIVYRMCKNKINMGMYETQEYMQLMLDVFFAGERITVEHYQELTQLLKSRHEEGYDG